MSWDKEVPGISCLLEPWGAQQCHRRREQGTTASIHHPVNTRLASRVSSARTVQHHSDFLAVLIPLWEVQGQKESPSKTDIFLNPGKMGVLIARYVGHS